MAPWANLDSGVVPLPSYQQGGGGGGSSYGWEGDPMGYYGGVHVHLPKMLACCWVAGPGGSKGLAQGARKGRQ